MFDFKRVLTTLTQKNTPENPAPLTKDEAAKLLSISPETLAAFEQSYQTLVLNQPPDEHTDFFQINAKQAAAKKINANLNQADNIIQRIVNELLAQTQIMEYDGHDLTIKTFQDKSEIHDAPVTPDLFENLTPETRPQLTGVHAIRDMSVPTSLTILSVYKSFQEETNPKQKQLYYNMFRQGLDILDIDPLTYAIIGQNQNSMSHWLPELIAAIKNQDFFKVPKTKIAKLPITILQLTRMDYMQLTPATKAIVNQFCIKAFELDETKEYFIKTGTYSSKFDFRNAHVHGAQEVRELGEYLLFIHFQALQMASPLAKPCIIGASTTNEWVVREYIQNSENLPSIYKGLPLRTEYRIFVDFDTCEILGTNPYWDPDAMLNRFGHKPDANSPHQIHDYIIYKNQADRLAKAYSENIDQIKANIRRMLPEIKLNGQWSIDIMQDGQDFYIIDMALAATSALTHCIPTGKLKPIIENWLPEI